MPEPRTVLLCLLTGQHVPNLLSVHHYRPDRLLLVESDAMRRRHAADDFLRALRADGLDYTDRCEVEFLDAEDDLDAIRALLRRAYGKHPSAEWTANATGGTKPMGIATYEFFKATAGRVVYTSSAKPTVILSLDGRAAERCDHRVSIRAFLAGYGFEPRKDDAKIREDEGRATRWAAAARVLAAHAASEDLLVLTDAERGRARERGWDIEPGQLTTTTPAVADSLRETFGLRTVDEPTRLIGKVGKYEARFLSGGWLEMFFWKLLSDHADDLGIWDVRLGYEVGKIGEPKSGNDLDVVFIQNYSLSMVECKSGAQSHDPAAEIVYKVDSVMKQFGALHVKPYLASTGTNLLDRKTGELKPSVSVRVESYKGRVMLADKIKQLADPAATTADIKAILFGSK